MTLARRALSTHTAGVADTPANTGGAMPKAVGATVLPGADDRQRKAEEDAHLIDFHFVEMLFSLGHKNTTWSFGTL